MTIESVRERKDRKRREAGIDRLYCWQDRAVARIEKRADESEDSGEGGELIVGYAAVFYREDDAGTEFDIWGDGEVVERILPGAFDHAIESEQDVRGLFNHDPDHLLGRTASGTLSLSVDDVGLRYEIDPPDTAAGRDTRTSIARGDLSGSSFAFWIGDEGEVVYREVDGVFVVEIVKIGRLFDVGPVTFPAYESSQSDLSSRSLDEIDSRRLAIGRSSRPRLAMAKRRLQISQASRRN